MMASPALYKNPSCFPRHSSIKFILKRTLTRIGLPSVMEPLGLTDDKSDLMVWLRTLGTDRDRSLIRDATVVDTFCSKQLHPRPRFSHCASRRPGKRCSDRSFFESDSSPVPRGRNPDPNLVCNENIKSDSWKNPVNIFDSSMCNY